MHSLPTPTSARPSHARYIVILFLCILAFLSYFDRVCISAVQSFIKKDLFTPSALWGSPEQQMGAIMSVFWLAYALFEMPGGWMGDRFGARSSLTRVVLCWSIFTVLTGCAGGFYSLLIYRFLFGAGEAGAFPIMARVQSRWLPASAQGRVSGVLWLVARWGGALSLPLFGMLLTASKSFKSFAAMVPLLHGLAGVAEWRMGFWVCGLAGIVWIAFFYTWFRDNPADKRSVNQAELDLITAGKHPKPHAVRDASVWAALFTSRSMWGLALLYVFGSFGFSFFVTYVPNYLSHEQHIDIKGSLWMSAAPLLCGGVTCLIGGIFSDLIARRLGRKRFARAIFPITGHFVAAAAIFGLRSVHTPAQAVVLLCITMGAYDFGLGAKWAAIVDVGGRHSGLAAGFVNMIGNLGGNCLQPIMAPWIITRFGWSTLLALYAVMYVLGAASWILIHPDKHFYPEEEDESGQGIPRGFEVQAPHRGR